MDVLEHLPRVLLLDVDGKVAWEGDPGFSSQSKPKPPFASYVDTPMEDLAERRQLISVRRWRESWQRKGESALASGDLAGAIEL